MELALVIGHTSRSPGACNKTYELCEFNFNENLAKDITDNLSNSIMRSIIVYRDYAGSYSKLPEYINMYIKPAFVVSLHCNAFNTKASGTETLYYYKSVKGKAMAKVFQENLVDVLNLPDRGTKGKGTEDRGGYILRYTHAPCIICEPFFIDNDNDLQRAKDKYDEFVDAFVKSIITIKNL
jgi:N-acetylmuramoyl-L-alanine amidase